MSRFCDCLGGAHEMFYIWQDQQRAGAEW